MAATLLLPGFPELLGTQVCRESLLTCSVLIHGLLASSMPGCQVRNCP